MRESFVFYDSYYEAISEFDETIQVHLFKAICEYALYEKVPELSGIEKALFTLIKPTIDANEKRYNNSKKGGRPKKTNGYENEKPNVNVNDNVNVTVNANVNSNANENKLPDKSARPPEVTKPEKHKLGEYCHVRLTDDEYKRLCDDFGTETTELYVRKIDEYLQMTGKKPYKDYNLTIRKWLDRDNIRKRSDDNESIFRSPDPNDAPF